MIVCVSLCCLLCLSALLRSHTVWHIAMPAWVPCDSAYALPRRLHLVLLLSALHSLQDKLAYIVNVVENCWATGRPVLIGTSTVNESELVLQVLQEWCKPGFRPLAARVQLLNAKPENVRLEAKVRSLITVALSACLCASGSLLLLCLLCLCQGSPAHVLDKVVNGCGSSSAVWFG